MSVASERFARRRLSPLAALCAGGDFFVAYDVLADDQFIVSFASLFNTLARSHVPMASDLRVLLHWLVSKPVVGGFRLLSMGSLKPPSPLDKDSSGIDRLRL